MKKNNIYLIISIVSFYIILFYILFLKWAINASVSPIVCVSTALLFMINFKKNIKMIKTKYIIIALSFLFIILLNLLFTYEHTYFYGNIVNAILMPFLSALYFVLIIQNEKEKLYKYIFKPSFFILNFYYIINFFIVLKQISTPGFLLHNFTTNSFYLDHVDGLIGANGTAKLMLFNIICINLNLSFSYSKNSKISKFSKFMFIFTLLSSCYVSLMNDSRMYYILLLLFMLPIFIKISKGNFNITKFNINVIRVIVIVIVMLFASLVLYSNNSEFKNLIDKNFIDNYFNRTVQDIGTSGNEERVRLLKIAVENGDGLKLGKGIGSLPFDGSGYVKHFGLNDFNVRIYNGGIIYVIILLAVYATIYEGILHLNSKQYLFRIYYFIILLILGLYTQVYTYCDKNILLSLIFITTYYFHECEERRNLE